MAQARAIAVAVLLALVSPALVGQEPTSLPTLVTDRRDYSPGDTVTLTGTHLTPTASYHIVITLPDGHTTRTLPATADNDGNFVVTYVLEGQESDRHAVLYDALGNEFAETEFHDSHFRYGHLAWRQTGPRTATFSLVNAFRRSAYFGSGPDRRVVTGDKFTETIGDMNLCFGDGFCTATLRYEVIAYDEEQDWVIGRALLNDGFRRLPWTGVTVTEVEPNDVLGLSTDPPSASANPIRVGDDYEVPSRRGETWMSCDQDRDGYRGVDLPDRPASFAAVLALLRLPRQRR